MLLLPGFRTKHKKIKLPIPHPQHFHLLDHLWKQSRGFSFHHPGARGFTGGFLKGQAPGKPVWSFLLCRETAQVGTHPCACLLDRQTPLRGCFALILTIRKASPAHLTPLWSQGHWLCSRQVCREAGWQLGPVYAHEQLWIASCFSIVPTCSFSLRGSDLGKSDVPVTGWGSFALKTLQSAHHNVHLLWQLVHPSPTIMSTNYLPFPVPGSHWLFSPFTKG